jgi:hypothetical protein
MNDQDKMQLALASMHTGQWFGFDGEINYENLIILDSSKTKPTEDEINTKIQEMENRSEELGAILGAAFTIMKLWAGLK